MGRRRDSRSCRARGRRHRSDRGSPRQRRVQARDGRSVDRARAARGRVKLEHRVTVDAPRAKVWAVLMDLPVAARCVPGTHEVAADGGGVRGTLDVRVGPVKLALGGTVAIESRDEAAGTARLRADAEDRRIGGAVRALVDLSVTGDAPTELRIASDVAVLGRIGELGQALIARQADKVLAGFAECLRATVAAR
ncbi:MAG: hypothetical protein E6I49_15840 [Chloroflexi bacterium]|nr:MAG: hypothetical protein E6I49_15840 [Chloroflexota bacterium]